MMQDDQVVSRLLGVRPSRRTVLKAGTAAGLGIALGVHVGARAKAQPSGLNFLPSGDDGGGFTSVVATDPFAQGSIIAGQDVSGLWRSADAGRTWTPAMTPADAHDSLFTAPAFTAVAAVTFSRRHAGTVYAGLGNRGQGSTQGGFAASTDGGASWALLSDVPLFAGGNDNVGGLPPGQLRSTGNLIQLDEDNGAIYVATFQDGVMRSRDGGHTWTVLGLQGTYLRGLALDPSGPENLYACPYGQGVWKTVDALGTGSFTRLASAPASVEELVSVGGALYAAGAGGIARSSDGGRAWEALPVPMGSTTSWISMAGTSTPQGTTLFAGCFGPPPESATSMYQSIIRSTDGGASWAPITVNSSRIHPTLGGPGGDVWWYSKSDAWPDAAMGGVRFIASYVAPDPLDPSRLYAAGKAGVWRTDNALDESPDWYACVRRLNATFHSAVAVDDSVTPYRVYLGDADWSFLYSTDGMNHVTISRFVPNQFAQAYGIAALPNPGGPATVYAATEVQGSINGDVYSSTDVSLPSNWTPEGLADQVHAHYGSYMDVIGVAVNRTAAGAAILAAVNGGGVWRKAGGQWTQVLPENTALATQKGSITQFAWLPDSPFVFFYDRLTGVWRSADAGLTWSLIWRHPAYQSVGVSGYLVQPSNDRQTVWASAYDGLYRLERAEGTGPGAVLEPSVQLPGPLAFRDGFLYVATYTEEGNAVPRLLRRPWPGAGPWTDLADDTFRAMGFIPHGLAVGPDGRVFGVQRGMGMVVGVP